MSLDLKDLIRTDYVKKYFNRNKNIFTISFIIFILFIIMGALVFDVEDIMGQTGIDQKINPQSLIFQGLWVVGKSGGTTFSRPS